MKVDDIRASESFWNAAFSGGGAKNTVKKYLASHISPIFMQARWIRGLLGINVPDMVKKVHDKTSELLKNETPQRDKELVDCAKGLEVVLRKWNVNTGKIKNPIIREDTKNAIAQVHKELDTILANQKKWLEANVLKDNAPKITFNEQTGVLTFNREKDVTEDTTAKLRQIYGRDATFDTTTGKFTYSKFVDPEKKERVSTDVNDVLWAALADTNEHITFDTTSKQFIREEIPFTMSLAQSVQFFHYVQHPLKDLDTAKEEIIKMYGHDNVKYPRTGFMVQHEGKYTVIFPAFINPSNNRPDFTEKDAVLVSWYDYGVPKGMYEMPCKQKTAGAAAGEHFATMGDWLNPERDLLFDEEAPQEKIQEQKLYQKLEKEERPLGLYQLVGIPLHSMFSKARPMKFPKKEE